MMVTGRVVFALLLAKHDLNEPYVHWRLKQFQKQQYETLRKKLNLSVEVGYYGIGYHVFVP